MNLNLFLKSNILFIMYLSEIVCFTTRILEKYLLFACVGKPLSSFRLCWQTLIIFSPVLANPYLLFACVGKPLSSFRLCWQTHIFFSPVLANLISSCSLFSLLRPIMEYREDLVYCSDEDLSEELFWSESDDEDYDTRPVCIGCKCKENTCEHLMPLNGTVLWGSTEWDIQDYINLNDRLLEIGVRLYYQCLRCLECEDCIPSSQVEYFTRVNKKQISCCIEGGGPNK